VIHRPYQHEAEERALNVFTESLPSSWIKRPEIPDYGIDFSIEVVENSLVTGHMEPPINMAVAGVLFYA